jgi:hypothetical protein
MTFGVVFVSSLVISKSFLFSISFNRLLAPFNPTNSRVADDQKEGAEIDEAAQNATLKVMLFLSTNTRYLQILRRMLAS